jgi:hypothetical protein
MPPLSGEGRQRGGDLSGTAREFQKSMFTWVERDVVAAFGSCAACRPDG